MPDGTGSREPPERTTERWPAKGAGASPPEAANVTPGETKATASAGSVPEEKLKRCTEELERVREMLHMEERRLEALLTLNQMTDAPMDDLLGFSLEKAAEITRSTTGYLLLMDEGESPRRIFIWPDTESATAPAILCRGFWRQSTRERGPVLVDDAPSPGAAVPPHSGTSGTTVGTRPPSQESPGTAPPAFQGEPGQATPPPSSGDALAPPDASPALIRHIHIPLFDRGRVTMVAGLGNKPSPYTPTDIRQLTILLQGTWAIVRRKQVQEEKSAINNELIRSLERLKDTQAHLVESEKMASLGNLVAGVAHEINTPLGVGITEASFLRKKTDTLAAQFKSGGLKRSDMNLFLKNARDAADNLLRNLERTARIVEDFKQVAVDRSNERRRVFPLKKQVEEILASLHHKLAAVAPDIIVRCDANLRVDSYPGVFSQIITQLVQNSLHHGFAGTTGGRITLELSREGDDLLFIYADNGKGMPLETAQRIFDPFFTTRRTRGGTGLGMHLVYNLVTRKLGGRITCRSLEGEGVTFTLRLPFLPPQFPPPEGNH